MRSLELNSNVFSRLARSTLLLKIRANPHWAAAFGYSGQRHECLGPLSSKPFKQTTRFSALSTSYLADNRERRRSNPPFSGEQTRDMPLQSAFSPESAHKGTRAFKLNKELLLEVLRFPLTCRRTLSPTSSPVAGAAITKLYVLDAGFSCGTQIIPASAGDKKTSC